MNINHSRPGLINLFLGTHHPKSGAVTSTANYFVGMSPVLPTHIRFPVNN